MSSSPTAQIDTDLLELFSRVIREKTGIHISSSKRSLLASKLSKLISREGFPNAREAYRRITEGDREALELLIRYITTTYTYFFRESSQLEALVADIERKRIGRPLIWCAACSTGEEAYSIAITLREHGIDDYMILASDINPAVLRHLKAGVYARERLHETDPKILTAYFLRGTGASAGRFLVKPELRRNLVVKRLNLLGDLVFEDTFHYVFCRNVMIYFDEAMKDHVLHVVSRNLKNDGLLFLGKSESILDDSRFTRAKREPSAYEIR